MKVTLGFILMMEIKLKKHAMQIIYCQQTNHDS